MSEPGHSFRFLIAEDDKDLRELFVLSLEMVFNAEIIEAASGQQAIEILKKDTDFDLVLSDYNMPNGNGGELFSYITNTKIPIRFILHTSDKLEVHDEFSNQSEVRYLQKPADAGKLEAVVRDTVARSQRVKKSSVAKSEFCKIRAAALYRMSALPCDIFVKLSDSKFVKLFNAGDVLGDEEVRRIREKKVEYVYMSTVSAAQFLDRLFREVASLKTIKSAGTSEQFEVTAGIQKSIHEFSAALGMTPEVIRMVRLNVAITMQAVRANPRLSSLFAKLSVDPENYIASHSIVLANIACGLAALQEWSSETTYLKLTMAALLHDICLNGEKFAHYRTEHDMFANMKPGETCSDEELKMYLNHPRLAAEMVATIPEILPDVATIIAQHHECPDGTGFPGRLDHRRIAPLSVVFIIAHDILRYHELNAGFDAMEFMLAKQDVYGSGLFRKSLLKMPALK